MQLVGDLAVIPIQANSPEGTPLFLSNLYWNKKIISTTPDLGAGRVGRQ